ncbi:hypothetical protein D3C74_496500 [compost metagenome]
MSVKETVTVRSETSSVVIPLLRRNPAKAKRLAISRVMILWKPKLVLRNWKICSSLSWNYPI